MKVKTRFQAFAFKCIVGRYTAVPPDCWMLADVVGLCTLNQVDP
jgi:hypothetical protein